MIGLGLPGQLTAQLLRAAGCEVIGIDLEQDLVQLAPDTGALDQGVIRCRLGRSPVSSMSTCDAVIITAATQSQDPVQLAAELSRDRGRVVIVGDVGMRLPRPSYYDKEPELRLSRSYGPGRYDREYEERGLDYPTGYVRWTEQRHMAAFVHLLAQGRIDVRPLVRTRVPVNQAPAAYDKLLAGNGSALEIVLQYPASSSEEIGEPDHGAAPRAASSVPLHREGIPLTAGVIGAGSFASRVLIPALQVAGFSLEAVASTNGLSARGAAGRSRSGAWTHLPPSSGIRPSGSR